MLTAYINGTAYQAERDFYISEQSGNKTSSEIAVLVEDQPIPVSGDIIELKDGTTTLFWGTCGIPKSPKYSTGLEQNIYRITCGNANSILANRIVNVAYQNYTVTQIVNDLYTNYIAQENISLGTISAIPLTMTVYTAADYNLQSALNELADLVGATWQVTNGKVFNFVVQENFPVFPQTVDSSFLLGSELQYTTKDYKTRTVQYVSGAQDKTNTQVETFTYAANQNSFTVSFGVAEKPSITVNGTAVPASSIGAQGLDSGLPFYFAYNSQIIAYDTSSGYLSAGNTVVISYTGLFSIRISVSNDAKVSQIAALTGTSGKRERVRLGTDIKTYNDALTVANQLLSQYSEATGEVSLWFLSSQLYAAGMTLDNTNVLTQISFNLPQFGVVGDFVITERKIEPFSADLTDFSEKLKVTLKLMNRDYLKSYAETLSTLKSDLSKLSIRDDDIVIQGNSVTEILALSESLESQFDIVFYAVGTQQYNSIFAPCDLGANVYPVGV